MTLWVKTVDFIHIEDLKMNLAVNPEKCEAFPYRTDFRPDHVSYGLKKNIDPYLDGFYDGQRTDFLYIKHFLRLYFKAYLKEWC